MNLQITKPIISSLIIGLILLYNIECIINESVTSSISKSIANNKSCDVRLNKITGTIFSLQNDDVLSHRRSLMDTNIVLNYGLYFGYPKSDGSFEIDNVPPESYVVEVNHPTYIYEPLRVDIGKTGKCRARKVNNLKPSENQAVEYPLVFRPRSIHNYFIPRETWRLMDLILNPMVIMMLIPLLIIWVLPKMMNPQEVQTQEENMQLPEYNVPELSEMMANMFGRQGPPGSTGNPQITGSGSTGGGRNRARRR